MIEVKTQKNYFVTDTEKDGYCFKSTTNQSISSAELAKQFSRYNATVTEPDALGMLSIENTLVCEYLAKGYTVMMPWGKMFMRANGTTSDPKGAFVPGTGNHRFNVIVEVNDEAFASITENVEYKQLEAGFVSDPAILSFSAVDDAMNVTETSSFVRGTTIRLYGYRLKAELTDTSQGVFFVADDGTETRASKYTRNGSTMLDVVLPADLPAGNYKVRVCTKPGEKRYAEFTSYDAITVTAE